MHNYICISGKSRSGKDVSAEIFMNVLTKKNRSVLIIHQADLLKYICKSYFGWDGEKNESGRTLLQYVGTDIIRNIEPDFWVNFISKITNFFKDKWEYIIIPDTRFPNEIENLKSSDANVYHVRVTRPDYENLLSEEQQNHISETALDDVKSDFVIINKTVIHDLYDEITNIVDAIEKNIKQ